MATGDNAQTAGLTKYASSQDARLGYDNDNQRGDDIADNRRIGVYRVDVGGQALATGGTGAVVLWNGAEIYDKFSMHSPTTNSSRITAGVAGLWEFNIRVLINSTTGTGTIWARLNGTTDIPLSGARVTGAATVLTDLRSLFSVVLALNDYVEIMVIESAASGTVVGGAVVQASFVQARFLGL